MGLPLNLVQYPCLAGVDIRPGSWDLIIGDLQRNRHTGKKVVRPVFVGKVRDEREVAFLLRQYRVRFGVTDCRPETTLAKRLQEDVYRHGIELWRAEYNTTPTSIKMQPNPNERLVKLDRTMTLDTVHHAFQTGQGIVLPQNFKDLTRGEFQSEMKGMTRVYTRWHGKDAYAWEKQGPDHAFHALNLLFVALAISGLGDFDAGSDGIIEKGVVETSFNTGTVDKVTTLEAMIRAAEDEGGCVLIG